MKCSANLMIYPKLTNFFTFFKQKKETSNKICSMSLVYNDKNVAN